jgi:hypothetical protein
MTTHLLLGLLMLAALSTPLLRPRRSRHAWSRGRAHTMRYEVYLRSPLWRARRRLWILQTLGRCENCHRQRRPLTIHHLTYQRLGHERRTDIQVLCWRCHRNRHDERRAR